MAKKRGFFGSHFQFSRWMGMSELKSNAAGIKQLMRDLTKKEAPEFKETFEEAIQRLNLTNDDVNKRALSFLKISMIYLFFAFCLCLYAIYLYFNNDVMGALMCLPIISVLLSFFFKEHFWYTQMKHRRLGLSFRDWLDSIFKGEIREV